MSKAIDRVYDIDDLLMLERAQVFQNNFTTDKADFIVGFPHLDDPFAANFQVAIDDAVAVPTSVEVDGEIIVVTEQLNQQLPLGQKALQKLYGYVEIAWDSKAREAEFGRSKYSKARKSQVKMKELLELANRVADKPSNKATLLTFGYTQADIDELKTIENTIDSLNATQEEMLSGRVVKTENRIKAYNSVWEYMKQINRASKITFADSPAKLEQYLLYPTVHNSLPKIQNFVGVLDNGPPLLVNMMWDLVQDAEEYEVERSVSTLGQPQGSWEPLTIVSATSLGDEVVANRSNYYRVRAKNQVQIGAWADTIRVDS